MYTLRVPFYSYKRIPEILILSFSLSLVPNRKNNFPRILTNSSKIPYELLENPKRITRRRDRSETMIICRGNVGLRASLKLT